jgi:hypothetical protein
MCFPLALLYSLYMTVQLWPKILVLLGTSWGTFWELDGNTLGTKKIFQQFPPSSPKEK